ncbi:MAG: DEAD/DEAH box helicase [Phycisphaerae bacterium]
MLRRMDRAAICDKFLAANTYQLYAYQEESLLAWFSCEGGVMVCAPTGMGKTLIAEAAVFEALHTRKPIYYTTPLIALTEQKYRELQAKAEQWGFSREDVGFITGNRRENPEALVRVVVAEILLNHLLASGSMAAPPLGDGSPIGQAVGHGGPALRGEQDVGHEGPTLRGGAVRLPEPGLTDFRQVGAVVMDEFHSFNDLERGVVWELSLVLLPKHVRVLLLSATVGNPYDFADWLRKQHGRKLEVVVSAERRVPLEFIWVEDKLLSEHLPQMVAASDEQNRTPALVFCFNRDECWEVAEKLKGLPLIGERERKEIEAFLKEHREGISDGVGPKLQQMLIRGVGVHHAGVLPRHKEIVEELFNRKLVPFVVCTETLAAGINLPARSVVVGTLLKGPPRERKLIPPSSAHQMFGRAGRPQFDSQGYVYAVAHDDDVKINKWKKKYEQLDPHSKDPVILRLRKELERKRPTRRSNEQYWTKGQFESLIKAGPAKLVSRSMIPYSVLIFLLTRSGTVADARSFLSKRFAEPARIDKFQQQLDFMLANLEALGHLSRAVDGQHVTLNPSIYRLLTFRSVDPLYGAFLAEQLNHANYTEKMLALESVLELAPALLRRVRIPSDLAPGPLQTQVLDPLMIQMGVIVAKPQAATGDEDEPEYDPWATEEELDRRPPTFPEMLKIVFDAKLASPEPVPIQPKWIGGDLERFNGEFFKFVRARELIKQEGLILRHLLRLVILASEFFAWTEDPDYQAVSERATRACRRVDPSYTDRFLAEATAMRQAVTA